MTPRTPIQLAPALTDPASPAHTPGVARLPVLKALTAVRFFAALHVALYHLVRPFSRWGLLAPAMSVGYTGVSFFFFLSGFILTYAHATEYEAGRGNNRKFWIARLARVYPVYFVSMLFALAVSWQELRNPLHMVAYLVDLAMLQAWSMRVVNFFNSGAWTLSCEAFFYLLFPLLLMRLRPRTRAAGLGWVAVFYLLAMLAPVLAIRLYPLPALTEPFVDIPGSGQVFLVSRLPLLALPEFLAGVSVGWLFLRFRPSPAQGAILATGGLVALAAALMLGDRLPYIALHNGLLIPIYAVLLLGLAQPNWLSRLLSASWLVLLGEASFALYLMHTIVSVLWSRFVHEHTIAYAIENLAVAVPVSILLHLYVERPCRRAILKWWAERHPRQMTVA